MGLMAKYAFGLARTRWEHCCDCGFHMMIEKTHDAEPKERHPHWLYCNDCGRVIEECICRWLRRLMRGATDRGGATA